MALVLYLAPAENIGETDVVCVCVEDIRDYCLFIITISLFAKWKTWWVKGLTPSDEYQATLHLTLWSSMVTFLLVHCLHAVDYLHSSKQTNTIG